MRSLKISLISLIVLLSLSIAVTNARIVPSKQKFRDLLARALSREPFLPSDESSAEDDEGVVVTGDCAFDVNGDLNDPAPIFTPHNKYEWIVPNTKGVVETKNGQFIDMYCSDSFIEPFTTRTKVTAQCLQRKYFLEDGLIYPFANFSCTKWPTYTARRTGRTCNGGTDLLEVGFVLEAGDGFLQTMDICHDEVNEVTRYVHHVLNPSSASYQHGVARPRFIEGDFYAGKNVDQIYTKVQQNATISDILGMDASQYFNDSINVYLARGHMAAKVDFIFGAPQHSTFFFVNVAPQWQVFNGGNWERVEDGVRKYVGNQALTVDCYTGVWGVSTLPDVNGEQKQLYLAFDENNNGLIPVPMLYYRIVIDRETRAGIVLIGVNNPHASLEQILEEYVICEDISDGISWINWSKRDLLKGYSYACSVPDFTAVVTDLPLEDLETSGILGFEDVTTTTAVTVETTPSEPTTEQPEVTATSIVTENTPTTEQPEVTATTIVTENTPTTEQPEVTTTTISAENNPSTEQPEVTTTTIAAETTPSTEQPEVTTTTIAAETTPSTVKPSTEGPVHPPHVYIDFY